jgi:hypothetical protein
MGRLATIATLFRLFWARQNCSLPAGTRMGYSAAPAPETTPYRSSRTYEDGPVPVGDRPGSIHLASKVEGCPEPEIRTDRRISHVSFRRGTNVRRSYSNTGVAFPWEKTRPTFLGAPTVLFVIPERRTGSGGKARVTRLDYLAWHRAVFRP